MYDPSTALERLQFVNDFMIPEVFATLIQEVIDSPAFYEAPASAPGSHHQHHAYSGGLMVHTCEVLNLCMRIDANAPELLVAAILHDFGKCWDYEQNNDGVWVKTAHYGLIRHVARSYTEFMTRAVQYELATDTRDRIGHMILAHHGRLAWGSPVEPQTREALILHSADMLSSQYGIGR